jgi:hypothetical protein
MLFVNHLTTFILAFLVFGSTVMAMPVVEENSNLERRAAWVDKGKFYQGLLTDVTPTVKGIVCVVPVIQRLGY